MVTLSRTISRALRRLQILISSFDWFIRLSASFVIGLTDYFGFDFSQWEREVNAPNKRQARENKLDQMQVTIGFGFPSVWLGKWRSFFWIKTIHRLFKYIRFTVEMKRKKKKKTTTTTTSNRTENAILIDAIVEKNVGYYSQRIAKIRSGFPASLLAASLMLWHKEAMTTVAPSDAEDDG